MDLKVLRGFLKKGDVIRTAKFFGMHPVSIGRIIRGKRRNVKVQNYLIALAMKGQSLERQRLLKSLLGL